MKRFLKSRIFIFILGLIVAGSVGVAAYTYNASQISYSPSDTTWNVNTVKAAIDDLYNKKSGAIDLSEKTTIDSENVNCYKAPKVLAYMQDGEMFISVQADTKEGYGCIGQYSVDISDLGLQSITYVKGIDLENYSNFRFYNYNCNTNTLSIGADTNYGYGDKQKYNYLVYYRYTK